ncbi:MAG: NACHT domain-containing protein, partial [Crocosphaera sp.]|nr:NACHT domain-containing protein [Crocosphaera sp.]
MTNDNSSNRAEIFGGKVQGFIQENNGTVNQYIISQLSEFLSDQTTQSEQNLNRDQCLQRSVLLTKVKQFWVKDVLEKSLYAEAMKLFLEERSNLVEHSSFNGFEEIVKDSKEAEKSIVDDATEFFEQLGDGRTLLILGEPGSGKTITLLRLAQQLIERAEENVSKLIPVVFNLSSWEGKQQKIADWLVEELWSKYQVAKVISEDWVTNQQLILLLDGLDEVKKERQEDCVKAINKFIQDHGQTEIVVCSRIQEYEAISTNLKLRGAIFIHALTPEQINQYLDQVGQPMEAVKTLLKEDIVLQELAKSPLTLSVMTLAYGGKKVEKLSEISSLEEQRKHLFDAYIQRMFSQEKVGKPKDYKTPYSKQKTKWWLTWLAKKMTKESQTVFLIENLQPEWLKNNSQKLLYVFAVPGFIFLSFDFFNYFISLPMLRSYYAELEANRQFSSGFSDSVTSSHFLSSIIISSYSIYVFIMAWKLILNKKFFLCIWFKKIAKIKFIGKSFLSKRLAPLGDFLKLFYKLLLFNYVDPKIQPIESINWSLGSAATTFKKNLIALQIFGAIFGIIFSIVFMGIIAIGTIVIELINVYADPFNTIEPLTIVFMILSFIIAGFFTALYFASIFSLMFLIILGPIVFVLGGVQITTSTEQTLFPNQGIWQSLKNIFVLSILGIFLGSVYAITIGLPFLIPMVNELKPTFTLTELLFLIYMIFSSGVIPLGLLAGGACIKHFILRIILYCNNYIPWNYASFLDYASDRIFLRKVGGSYIFVHR